MAKEILGLDEFLDQHPSMGLRVGKGGETAIEGVFRFSAQYKIETVTGEYRLRISIPSDFPDTLPRVRELNGDIPRDEGNSYHLNDSGYLCLGSELGLRVQLEGKPTLPQFINKCLIPYLYAVTKRLKDGKPLVFSELAHGAPGILDDCKMIFGLGKADQIIEAFRLLSLKRKDANNSKCPCGCGRVLKHCKTHAKLALLRRSIERSWFKKHHESFKNISEGSSTKK